MKHKSQGLTLFSAALMDETTSIIGEALASELKGFKFVKSRGHLLRVTDSGWQAVAIHAQRTATPGNIKLAAHAQVRVNAIEEIYVGLHPFVDAKSAKFHPTLVVNCDTLLGDKTLAHGVPSDEVRLRAFALKYASDMKENILPWLEKYMSEEVLFDGLFDPDPKKSVTSDPLTRYPLLMAILARRGDWPTFDRISAEFAAYCTQRHTLVHKPLSDAMARLRVGSQPPQ